MRHYPVNLPEKTWWRPPWRCSVCLRRWPSHSEAPLSNNTYLLAWFYCISRRFEQIVNLLANLSDIDVVQPCLARFSTSVTKVWQVEFLKIDMLTSCVWSLTPAPMSLKILLWCPQAWHLTQPIHYLLGQQAACMRSARPLTIGIMWSEPYGDLAQPWFQQGICQKSQINCRHYLVN